jgi:hypothetical protein
MNVRLGRLPSTILASTNSIVLTDQFRETTGSKNHFIGFKIANRRVLLYLQSQTPCNAVLEQPQNLHEAIAAASDSSIGI